MKNHNHIFFSRFSDIIEAMPDALLIVNKAGFIVFLNKQTEHLFGYLRDELLGKKIEQLIPERYRKYHFAHRDNYNKKPVSRPMGIGLELFALKKDGTEFPVEIGLSPLTTEIGQFTIANIRDITQQKKVESQLKYLAEHDSLTGLIDEMLLKDRILQAMNWTKRYHSKMAVCFLDMDNFKQINDTYGHATGDRLLSAVAKRLQTHVRDVDTVARAGGDEFVLVLVDIHNVEEAIKVVKKVQRTFSKQFMINNVPIKITFSIGIAIYPDEGDQNRSLLEKADAAMYDVKAHGKNNFKLFDDMCDLKH